MTMADFIFAWRGNPRSQNYNIYSNHGRWHVNYVIYDERGRRLRRRFSLRTRDVIEARARRDELFARLRRLGGDEAA